MPASKSKGSLIRTLTWTAILACVSAGPATGTVSTVSTAQPSLRTSAAQPAYAHDAYRVTLLRAAPGELQQLIDAVKQHKERLLGNAIIMRHSQGDHWDLMLLSPVGEDPLVTTDFGNLASFQHDFLAGSTASWDEIRSAADSTGLFHIEMFQAAAGQYDALLREREMENDYLENTGRAPNIIFETIIGSDTDVFTIGFYADMVAFATDPDLTDEAYQQAAADAGFESRASIGLYLRQFIIGHQDTLATHVR